jgi:hypothetical protein
MLYLQAVWGRMEFAGICDISTKYLSKIRAIWQFIALGELLAFGSNGQAVCVSGQGDDLQLFAGDRTPLALHQCRVGKSVNYCQNKYNFL